MGLRTFPGKFLVRVWSLVAIRAEMSNQHDQTCPNLSTIQWPCTLSAQRIFLHFRMLLFFSITSYPAEIAYFNSPNRELSNGVSVVELCRREVALHTGSHLMPIEAWRRAVSTTSDKSSWSKNGLKKLPRQIFSVCVCEVWWESVQRCRNSMTKPVQTCPQYSDHVRSLHSVIFCTFECSYSSVLRPILVKLHILTCLIESFPMVYGLWSCIVTTCPIALKIGTFH